MKKTIIILSDTPWNFGCDYIKQIGLSLSKENTVLFYNPRLFPSIKNIIFDKKRRREWLAPTKNKNIIYFPTLGIIPFQGHKFIYKLNIYLNLFVLLLYIKIKFKNKKPIFWAFHPWLVSILKIVKHTGFIIYDRPDQYASVDKKEHKYLKNIDKQTIKFSNKVIVNSPLGYKFAKKYNQNTLLAPWGCDTSLFKNYKQHSSIRLAQIKQPIIGMVGAINYRIDLKLLYNLAQNNSQWSFVFVGRLDGRHTTQNKLLNFDYHWGNLVKLDNVHYLGPRDKKYIPSIISAFNVCLIPYDITQEYNQGSHPMKFYEYLALGKPIVSTSIEALKQYAEPIVYLADSAKNTQTLIKKILKTKSTQAIINKRKQIASRNTWNKRIKCL